MSDLLAMLKAQRELQDVMPPRDRDIMALSPEDRVEAIRWNVLALTDELHEMLNEVGWKPWATSRHVRTAAAVGELVDAWHFFMNLLMLIGCRDEEDNELSLEQIEGLFTRMYFAKRSVNFERQREGYDGVTGKCPRCGRDTDEILPVRAEGFIFCVCGERLRREHVTS